jgi:hypothetical protein
MAINIDLQPIFDEISTPSDGLNLSFSQLIYEKYVGAKSITDLHNIQTGVKCGSKIPLADRGRNYDYMKAKDDLTSNCDFNECDVTTTFSVKSWDTKEYNCKVTLCRKDLECDFEKWWNENGCNDADDVSDNFIKFLVDWIGSALVESHWTKVWFSDSSLATSSTLYGADGLFIQMAAIAPPANVEQRVVIAENANATYALQDTLAADTGFETYSAMYDLALENMALAGNETNLGIETTQKLAVNYLQYLRANNQVNCCFKSDVTEGKYRLDNLNIFGLPIRIRTEWDEIIRGTKSKTDTTPIFAELNDGTRWTEPHRAVLTYKENIPVGVCNAGKLENVDVLYNPYDRNISIASEYEIGATVIWDDEFILGQ